MIDTEPRCWRCDKKLGEELTRPWEITCTRCNATNKSGKDYVRAKVVLDNESPGVTLEQTE